MSSILELEATAVAELPCYYCAAEPGDPCVVANGRTAGARARFTHEARVRIVRLVWIEGYYEGGREVIAMLRDPFTPDTTYEQALARAERLFR